MTAVCRAVGAARSNVAEQAPPQDELLADIKAVIADMPSYG
jgi:hypothetical protein